MEPTVGLFEAKTRLSELCERVARRGEIIVITKRGRAVAQLAPVRARAGRSSVWKRRAQFIRREGPIREELVLPDRRIEPARDPLD